MRRLGWRKALLVPAAASVLTEPAVTPIQEEARNNHYIPQINHFPPTPTTAWRLAPTRPAPYVVHHTNGDRAGGDRRICQGRGMSTDANTRKMGLTRVAARPATAPQGHNSRPQAPLLGSSAQDVENTSPDILRSRSSISVVIPLLPLRQQGHKYRTQAPSPDILRNRSSISAVILLPPLRQQGHKYRTQAPSPDILRSRSITPAVILLLPLTRTPTTHLSLMGPHLFSTGMLPGGIHLARDTRQTVA